jgi:hypothetical protein
MTTTNTTTAMLSEEEIEREIIKALRECEINGAVFGAVPFLKVGDLMRHFARAIEQKVRSPAAAAQPELDAAGHPKLTPTILEQNAIIALNGTQAWLDSDRKAPFPDEIDTLIRAVILTFEQRRKQREMLERGIENMRKNANNSGMDLT